MKKVLIVISLLAVVSLVGCSTNTTNEVPIGTNGTINESSNVDNENNKVEDESSNMNEESDNIDFENSNINDEEDNVNSENSDEGKILEDDEISVGDILVNDTWECYSVLDKVTMEELDMSLVFGSGLKYGLGSLNFYEDGTFKNILPGISSSETLTDGTYVLEGIDIYMTYSDGKTAEQGKVFITAEDTKLQIITENYRMNFRVKEK